jgi:hypothetical protein
MPLAAGVFTAILQLTLVSEGWPLRKLGRVSSGLAALLVSWAVGIAAYLLIVGTGPVTDPGGPIEPGVYGAWLTCLGGWQLVYFVALRGWPFNTIDRRVLRLPAANIVVIACASATYLVLRNPIGWAPQRITAVFGCLIAALLVMAMLFEAWPWILLSKLPGRTGVLVTAVVLAALLYWGLSAVAGQQTWERRHPDDWVAYAALNGLGLGIILQVAIWRRWPLTTDAWTRKSPCGSTARSIGSSWTPGRRCWTRCASGCGSPPPRKAATTASAAPARYCWTATGRSAAWLWRWPTTARTS